MSVMMAVLLLFAECKSGLIIIFRIENQEWKRDCREAPLSCHLMNVSEGP